MKKSIIITAGGIGKRMGGNLPKQFLVIGNKPVLMHTLERIFSFDAENLQLILTLPATHIDEWRSLCSKYHFTIPHEVVLGGSERYDSVKNALSICKYEYIGVHDGVRPFVNSETWNRLFNAVQTHAAVIPVLGVRDSLRKMTEGVSQAVDRSFYRIVQTPQVFKSEILKVAYELTYSEAITDDATLVEQSGVRIHLVEGNEENIKLTTPMDLKLAQLLLQ